MEAFSRILKFVMSNNCSIMSHFQRKHLSVASCKRPNIADFQYLVADELVSSAAKSLLSGNIIAVPTDTIYGIAGLAQNTEAVRMLYTIKKRDPLKPVAICVSKISDISRWCKVTIPKELLQSLLPGPVTLAFERTNELNPELNPESSLVGVRIPNHGLLLDIVRKIDSPLALTSANISSTRSSLEIKEFEHLWPQLDLIVDGGKLGCTEKSRQGSTVVDLSRTGYYSIIRNGSAYEATRQTLHQFNLAEIKN